MSILKKSRNIINLGNKYKVINSETDKCEERWHTKNVLTYLSSDTKLYKQKCFEIAKKMNISWKNYVSKIASLGGLFGNIIIEGIPQQNLFDYIDKLRKMTCPITEDEGFAYKLSKVQNEIIHLLGIPYVNICIDNYIENTFDVYFDTIKNQINTEDFDGLAQIESEKSLIPTEDHYKIFADNSNISMTILVNFDKIYRYLIERYGHKELATDIKFLFTSEELNTDFYNAFIAALIRDQYRAHFTEQGCLILNILAESDETGLTQINTLNNFNYTEPANEKYKKIIKDIYINKLIDYEINKKLKDHKTKMKSSIDIDLNDIGSLISYPSDLDPSELICAFEPTPPCLTQGISAFIKEYTGYKSPSSCSLIYNDVRYPDSPTNIIKTSLYLCRLIPILYFKVYFINNGKDHVNLEKTMDVFRKYLEFAQYRIAEYELFSKGIIPYIENTLKYTDYLDSKFYNPMLTTKSICFLLSRTLSSLDYKENQETEEQISDDPII